MRPGEGAADLLAQVGTADNNTISTPESAYSVGRTQVIRRLLAQCLHDRELCVMLERYRDGIVYRLPLREVGQ